jgi:hypothetical protein
MSNETIQVIFVNTVAVSGFNNGICNFAFSTANFLPKDGKVDVAETSAWTFYALSSFTIPWPAFLHSRQSPPLSRI